MNTISKEDLKFIKFKPDSNVISETHTDYNEDYITEKVNSNLDTVLNRNFILSDRNILPYEFISNTHIINLTINNVVKEIKDFAFCNCDNLKCVMLATNDIISIGKGVFHNCSDLTTVKLNNVKNISESCFNNCTNLSSINLDLNELISIDNNAFCNCKSLQSINLGNNIKTIGIGAFNYCSNLSEIILGNSIETIDIWSFYNCNIKKVTIPKSVKYINDYAFANNENLTNVIIEGNPNISENAFENCKNVKITMQSN